ncbi:MULTISPECIES: alpha/beta hydrolase [unclassified Bradyrhizobium]
MQARAAQWGSELVNIDANGHINGASNLGDWPEGRRILKEFRARMTGS